MKFAKALLNRLKISRDEETGKMTSFSLIFYIGVILVIIALIGGLIHQRWAYKNFEVVSSITKTDNVAVNYQVMGDGLLRYSKDGVSYSVNLEENVWNQSFEMASARTATCGNYLAIGDIGSNQIRIFNQAGQVGSVITSYPIVDVGVASQGVAAAILSEGGSNYIYLYSSTGEELVAIKTNVSQMGYPLDFALSQDGEKLVVSYLNIEDGTMRTNLVFYSFGSAGANEVDHIMGSFEYDSIIPKVEFLDNGVAAVYEEKGFSLYSMDYYPELIREVDFDQEIKSVFSSDKYIGFIWRNPIETDSDKPSSKGRYHMEVYTTSGRLYMQTDFDFEYQTVTNTNHNIVLYNDSECVVYAFNGKEKFRYTFNEKIIKLLPKSKLDEYILISSSAIEEIRLK